MSINNIKEAIVYPEAWDTMAYPTLEDALWELYCWEKTYRQLLEKKLEKLNKE